MEMAINRRIKNYSTEMGCVERRRGANELNIGYTEEQLIDGGISIIYVYPKNNDRDTPTPMCLSHTT
jgi:hypothetical protein